MDKYEFKLSLNEINKLIQERRFGEAADIADTIDWNHVKSTKTLGRVGEVYKIVGDYGRSRDVMEIAYSREQEEPTERYSSVVYSLCELSFQLFASGNLQNDYARGLQLLQEYQELEPENPKRLILQYRMLDVSHVSTGEKITILEQLQKEAPKKKANARWEYELAKLYAETGDGIRAAALCTEVMSYGGKYGAQAQQLLERIRVDQQTDAGAPAVDLDAVREVIEEKQEDRVRAHQAEKPETPKENPLPEVTVEYDAPASESRPESGMPASAGHSAYEYEEAETAENIAAQSRAASAAGPSPAEPVPADADAAGIGRGTEGAVALRSEKESAPADSAPAAPEEKKDAAPSASAGGSVQPGTVTDTETSISEVMAEWERIRADIRRANEEKRAQRILEDTGNILQNFDETARHGLLEDIEKGAARNRRNARSSRYGAAMSGSGQDSAPAGGDEDVRRVRRGEEDGFDDEGVRRVRRGEEDGFDDEGVRRVRRGEEEGFDNEGVRRVHRGDEDVRRVRRGEEDGFDGEGVRRVRRSQGDDYNGEGVRRVRPAENSGYVRRASAGRRTSLRYANPEPRYPQPEYTEPAPEEVQSGEPAYEEPEYTEPAPEEVQSEEPAYEEPEYTEPAPEEAQADEPAYEEPEYAEAVPEETQAEEPAYDEPEYTEPAPEEAQSGEPAYEEPKYAEAVPEETRAQEPAYDEPEYAEAVPEETQSEEPAYDEPEYAEPAPKYRTAREETPVRTAPAAPRRGDIRVEVTKTEPEIQDEAPSAVRRGDIPLSNEDDDTRVYRMESADAATRRWNAEEVHRAVIRGEKERAAAQKAGASARAAQEEPVPPYVPGRAMAAVRTKEQEIEDAFYDELDEESPEADVRPEAGAPVYKEPAYDEPVYEEPEREEIPAGEPMYGEPEYEEPVREEIPAAEPEYDEPAYDEPEYTEPAPEEAQAGEPADEEPEESAPAGEKVRTPGRTAEKPARAGARSGGETPEQTEEETPAKEESAEVHAGGPKGKRELTREERRLFGPFCRMQDNVDQLTEALEQISLSSVTGNLLILGNEATADRVAKGILDILRRSDPNFIGKIAKATGESLNRLDPKGFAKTFGKLENGALIVTRASDIAPKTMDRLYQELEGHDHGLILILTDGNKKMEQFRRDNEKYLGSFTAVITIKPLDDKALVSYAKDYALSQDYSIDEFGQLALAQRISSMQTQTHHVTLKEVRDLVDEAISYASKKNVSTLMEIVTRKRYDEDDRIILHEKDFTHY